MAKCPSLTDEAAFYWANFDVLASDRPAVMSGVSPIPISSILRWADHLEMTRVETDNFVEIIRKMDGHYCKCVREKLAKAAKREGSSGR